MSVPHGIGSFASLKDLNILSSNDLTAPIVGSREGDLFACSSEGDVILLRVDQGTLKSDKIDLGGLNCECIGFTENNALVCIYGSVVDTSFDTICRVTVGATQQAPTDAFCQDPGNAATLM